MATTADPTTTPATLQCDYFVGELTAKRKLTQGEATFYTHDDVFAALRDDNLLKYVQGVHVSAENKYIEIAFTDERAFQYIIHNGLNFRRNNKHTNLTFEEDAPPTITVTVVDVPIKMPQDIIVQALHEHGTIVDDFVVQKRVDKAMYDVGKRGFKFASINKPIPRVINIHGRRCKVKYDGQLDQLAEERKRQQDKNQQRQTDRYADRVRNTKGKSKTNDKPAEPVQSMEDATNELIDEMQNNEPSTPQSIDVPTDAIAQQLTQQATALQQQQQHAQQNLHKNAQQMLKQQEQLHKQQKQQQEEELQKQQQVLKQQQEDLQKQQHLLKQQQEDLQNKQQMEQQNLQDSIQQQQQQLNQHHQEEQQQLINTQPDQQQRVEDLQDKLESGVAKSSVTDGTPTQWADTPMEHEKSNNNRKRDSGHHSDDASVPPAEKSKLEKTTPAEVITIDDDTTVNNTEEPQLSNTPQTYISNEQQEHMNQTVLVEDNTPPNNPDDELQNNQSDDDQQSTDGELFSDDDQGTVHGDDLPLCITMDEVKQLHLEHSHHTETELGDFVMRKNNRKRKFDVQTLKSFLVYFLENTENENLEKTLLHTLYTMNKTATLRELRHTTAWYICKTLDDPQDDLKHFSQAIQSDVVNFQSNNGALENSVDEFVSGCKDMVVACGHPWEV